MDRWFGRSENFKAFIADKAKALALYNQHVIKGAISKASVQAGPRDVTTLRGRAGTLKTGDNGALMLDGIRLEDQVIEASNGVIFIGNEVLLP